MGPKMPEPIPFAAMTPERRAEINRWLENLQAPPVWSSEWWRRLDEALVQCPWVRMSPRPRRRAPGGWVDSSGRMWWGPAECAAVDWRAPEIKPRALWSDETLLLFEGDPRPRPQPMIAFV